MLTLKPLGLMDITSELVQDSNTTSSFDQEVDGVLRELRPALVALLERLDPPVRRATHLRKVLNLSQQASWSLFNAATTRDPRSLVSLLPGRRVMDGFFSAVAEQPSVPAELVERARAAFSQFEESVARHAGSRDAFGTMISDAADGESEQEAAVDFKQKRAAFRANALLWGRQAVVSCGTTIVCPSRTHEHLDVAILNGLIDLRRTRRGVPLQLMSRRKTKNDDETEPISRAVSFEPIDPREDKPDSFGLLQDFCSRPLPRFRLRGDLSIYQRYELVSESIGASSKMTYFSGVIARKMWIRQSIGAREDIHRVRVIAMPVETEISDLIVHESVCEGLVPEVKVYSVSLDGPQRVSEENLLPFVERIEDLGAGVEVARTPLVPRYTEMVEYVMGRLGWKSDEFRIFRCRVDYPVIHTLLSVYLKSPSRNT